jgi:hypothetical protein
MEQSPGEPPSRWTVINDYSKTVVAVCAALLAFIGAFSSKLVDGQLTTFGVVDVYVTVGFLCLAALCALAVPGMLDRYLRIAAKGLLSPAATEKNPDSATQKEWDSRATKIKLVKGAANLSYGSLGLAVLGLALFAAFHPFQKAHDENGGEQPGEKNHGAAGPLAAPRYTIAYSALHHTNHGQQVHTFLLDQATGEVWQMVCSSNGLVSFRRLHRYDSDGKVEAPPQGDTPALTEQNHKPTDP